MMKTVSVIAFLFLAVAEASAGEHANLLIGKWKLASGATGCNTSMTYTEKSVTQVAWNGTPSTIAVTYVTGDSSKFPATVYVMTNAGIDYHVTYIFSSKDKVMVDTGAMCTYDRL
jgi:hypothetical protein